MPATGQPIDVMSISLITVRDGRIVHYDVLADRLGLLGQVRAGAELKRGPSFGARRRARCRPAGRCLACHAPVRIASDPWIAGIIVWSWLVRTTTTTPVWG